MPRTPGGWYPLDDPRMPTLAGGYKVPNWDGKGEGDQFFAESGVPTTYLLTPFHWEAFVDGLGDPGPVRRGHRRHRRRASPPGRQLAAGLSEVFGEPVRYQHIPAEVFRESPFPGADLAANMF